LDTTPWLRDVVRKRNPFTRPLNLLQVIWLERARTGEPDAQAEAHEVVRLTIQGVASALRNTG
jgi:phosphoenolpyruvate carboxylase